MVEETGDSQCTSVWGGSQAFAILLRTQLPFCLWALWGSLPAQPPQDALRPPFTHTHTHFHRGSQRATDLTFSAGVLETTVVTLGVMPGLSPSGDQEAG